MGHKKGRGPEMADEPEDVQLFVEGDQQAAGPLDDDDVAPLFDSGKGRVEEVKIDGSGTAGDVGGCGELQPDGDDLLDAHIGKLRVRRISS